ncbi:hypothetical protein L195_g057253, partial [Trifolium pratense]
MVVIIRDVNKNVFCDSFAIILKKENRTELKKENRTELKNRTEQSLRNFKIKIVLKDQVWRKEEAKYRG